MASEPPASPEGAHMSPLEQAGARGSVYVPRLSLIRALYAGSFAGAPRPTRRRGALGGALWGCITRCLARLPPLRMLRGATMRALNSRAAIAVILAATCYVLFADDVRVLAFSKDADETFTVLSTLCFFLFIGELLLRSWAETSVALTRADGPAAPPSRGGCRLWRWRLRVTGYLGSFIFLLDILSIISLLPEIDWLWESIVGSGGSVAAESLSAARASRITRVGSRLGRIIRMVRVVRLFKLYSLWKAEAWWAERREHRKLGLSAGGSRSSGGGGGDMSTLLAATRRSSDAGVGGSSGSGGGVGAAAALSSDRGAAQAISSGKLPDALPALPSRGEGAAMAPSSPLSPPATPTASSQPDLVSLEALGAVRESEMGHKLSEATTRTVIALVLALILVTPVFTYAIDNTVDEVGTTLLHRYGVWGGAGWQRVPAQVMEALSRWTAQDGVLAADVGTPKLVLVEMDTEEWVGCGAGAQVPFSLAAKDTRVLYERPDVLVTLRASAAFLELQRVEVLTECPHPTAVCDAAGYWASAAAVPASMSATPGIITPPSTPCPAPGGGPPSNVTLFRSSLWLNTRPVQRTSAALSVGLTSFIIVLLLVGALQFSSDAHLLVLRPLENMIAFVERVAMDPATAASHVSSKDNTGTYETRLLENTIKKIVSVLRVGFGQAGLSILGQHLTSAGQPPTPQGAQAPPAPARGPDNKGDAAAAATTEASPTTPLFSVWALLSAALAAEGAGGSASSEGGAAARLARRAVSGSSASASSGDEAASLSEDAASSAHGSGAEELGSSSPSRPRLVSRGGVQFSSPGRVRGASTFRPPGLGPVAAASVLSLSTPPSTPLLGSPAVGPGAGGVAPPPLALDAPPLVLPGPALDPPPTPSSSAAAAGVAPATAAAPAAAMPTARSATTARAALLSARLQGAVKTLSPRILQRYWRNMRTSTRRYLGASTGIFDPYRPGSFRRIVASRLAVPHFSTLARLLGPDLLPYFNRLAELTHNTARGWGAVHVGNSASDGSFLLVWSVDDAVALYEADAEVAAFVLGDVVDGSGGASSDPEAALSALLPRFPFLAAATAALRAEVRGSSARLVAGSRPLSGFEAAAGTITAMFCGYGSGLLSEGDAAPLQTGSHSQTEPSSARSGDSEPQDSTKEEEIAAATGIAPSSSEIEGEEGDEDDDAASQPDDSAPGALSAWLADPASRALLIAYAGAMEAADRALAATLAIQAAVASNTDLAECEEAARLRDAEEIKGHRPALSGSLHACWAVQAAVGTAHKVDAGYWTPHFAVLGALAGTGYALRQRVTLSGEATSLLSPTAVGMTRMLDVVAHPLAAPGSRHCLALVGVDAWDWGSTLPPSTSTGRSVAAAPEALPLTFADLAAQGFLGPDVFRRAALSAQPGGRALGPKLAGGDGGSGSHASGGTLDGPVGAASLVTGGGISGACRRALHAYDRVRSVSILGSEDIIDHVIATVGDVDPSTMWLSNDTLWAVAGAVASTPAGAARRAAQAAAVSAYLSGDWSAAKARFEALGGSGGAMAAADPASNALYAFMAAWGFSATAAGWRGFRETALPTVSGPKAAVVAPPTALGCLDDSDEAPSDT